MCTLLYTVSPFAADEVTEKVDSFGNLEEGESSSVGGLLDINEKETDPRVKEVGCRNDGISNCIEIYDYMVMNIHVGLSVCGILFCLQIFRYTSKQLESQSLIRSVGMCRLSM